MTVKTSKSQVPSSKLFMFNLLFFQRLRGLEIHVDISGDLEEKEDTEDDAVAFPEYFSGSWDWAVWTGMDEVWVRREHGIILGIMMIIRWSQDD